MMVRNSVFKILIHRCDIFYKKVDRRGRWIWRPTTGARPRQNESGVSAGTGPQDWDNW